MPRQPPPSGTHQRGAVAGVGVVLDLPQSLIEAFPLVGLPVLIFPLVVGKEVLGSQEGSGGRNHGQSWVSPAAPGGTRGKTITPGRDTYVSCVPKKKMGYLLGGGFTAPSAISSICSERPVTGWLRGGAALPTDQRNNPEVRQVTSGKACRVEGSLQPRRCIPSRQASVVFCAPPPPLHTCPLPHQGCLSAPKIGASPEQSQKRSSEQPGGAAELCFYELPGPSHRTPSR